MHGRADWPGRRREVEFIVTDSGARVIEQGNVVVLGGDMHDRSIAETSARASPGCRRGWAKPLPHLVGV